jgi:hypothetical protein
MKGQSKYAPSLLGLTTDGVHVCLFIRARNTIADYFHAGTASSALAGVFFLREAVRNIMFRVGETGYLTRYPQL